MGQVSDLVVHRVTDLVSEEPSQGHSTSDLVIDEPSDDLVVHRVTDIEVGDLMRI
jgi:hypothetical protein